MRIFIGYEVYKKGGINSKKECKNVLDEISIHIYKNLIRGAYDRNEKYIKRLSTRKRKPKNIWIKSAF